MPSRNVIKHYREGAVFHAFNRGINGAEIFLDDHDRGMFIDSLARRLPAPHIKLLAYCLMPNHFHLVLHQHEIDSITHFMRSAMTSYVKRFNARHNRYGALFQGTFKATDARNLAGTRAVIAYTHLNPLDLRRVHGYESYEFSSHKLFTGERTTRWFDGHVTDELFGGIDGYLKYMRGSERARKKLDREVSALWSPIAPRIPNGGRGARATSP